MQLSQTYTDTHKIYGGNIYTHIAITDTTHAYSGRQYMISPTKNTLTNNNPTIVKQSQTHSTNNLHTHNTSKSLTTTQVQNTIKHGKSNNCTGPDKLNIRYLKHTGLLGTTYLTNLALNNNIIPHICVVVGTNI